MICIDIFFNYFWITIYLILFLLLLLFLNHYDLITTTSSWRELIPSLRFHFPAIWCARIQKCILTELKFHSDLSIVFNICIEKFQGNFLISFPWWWTNDVLLSKRKSFWEWVPSRRRWWWLVPSRRRWWLWLVPSRRRWECILRRNSIVDPQVYQIGAVLLHLSPLALIKKEIKSNSDSKIIKKEEIKSNKQWFKNN